MSNPHYLPAVYIQANIINFTVTFDGLQEQLLSAVVKQVRAITHFQTIFDDVNVKPLLPASDVYRS